MKYGIMILILWGIIGMAAMGIAADHSALSYRELAEYHRSLDDEKLTMAYYAKALAVNPDDALTLQSRGFYYLTLKKTDLALEDFSRQIRIRPDEPAGYLNRGMLLSTLGRDADAIADFTRACRLGSPDGCVMGETPGGRSR